MQKQYVRKTYSEVHPSRSIPYRSYTERIASSAWRHFEDRRKIIYDWLNKTDAPQEVWDACEPEFHCIIA